MPKHEWRAVIGGTGYIEADRYDGHGVAFFAGFAPCTFCGKPVPKLRDDVTANEECPNAPHSLPDSA